MHTSPISKKAIKNAEAIAASEIRAPIFDLIKASNPAFSAEDYISIEELNQYRRLYLKTVLAKEQGDLNQLDHGMMDIIGDNVNQVNKVPAQTEATNLTLGQRMADKIATFGGSWTFIICFFTFILVWMIINIVILASDKVFDPYPFILLNLILSCLAAIQAPIIMMSQNRQEEKDRDRAEHDYHINLKAELEIKLLSEKIDHLLVHHNKKLLEIQEVQLDYLQDLMDEVKKGSKAS